MGTAPFFSGPAARKFLLGLMGDVQALNDTNGDLVADLRNFVELDEFLKIVENILPALEAAVPDVVGGIGVAADEFSEDELKRIIAFATGIQDALTPYSDRRHPRVDDLIFERAKILLFVQAIGKRLGNADVEELLDSVIPPELAEVFEKLVSQFDETSEDLNEAADRLSAGSEDIREAAHELLGASPVTIRDDGPDTDTVIEFRPPGPHAEVVTVPLATAEVKAFIAEIDETMRPIKQEIDALFVDMRATVDEVFGEAGADWRAFGDTAAGALRDILAAHGDMMGRIAQLLSPLGDLVGGALGGGAVGGGGIGGGADSGGGPSSGAQAPVRRYAEGGFAPAGLPALVGEEGPELFIPDIFDDLGVFSARRTFELNLKFTRNVDATGAAPGVEQGIHRVLDDFQTQLVQDLESEFRPLAQRLGLNLRVKAA